MSKSTFLTILALSCLAACGSDTSDPAATDLGLTEQRAGLVPTQPLPQVEQGEDAPMTIASLVPDGSIAWLRVASFDELSGLLNELLAASGVGMDLDSVLKLLPVQGVFENLDRRRELGLAIGVDEDSGEPTVTLMLPVLDRGAVIQGLRELPEPPQCFGIDGYVVATTEAEYRPGLGSAALTDDLPAAQIAARIDLAALTERFGPILQSGLSQVASSSPAGLRGAADQVTEALAAAGEAAESLDLALGFEDGELDLQVAFVAASGSKLDGLLPEGSGSLYDLARCADGVDSASLLLTVDADTLQDELLPFYEQALASAMTSEGGEHLLEVMHEWGALMPVFGDSIVVSMHEGQGGLELAWYCRPTDKQALLDGIGAVLGSLDKHMEELRVSGPEERGALEHSWAIDFEGEAQAELAQAFPGRETSLRVGERRDITVITLGGDELAMSRALERTIRSEEEVDSTLRGALQRVGDANPAFVARVDLASLVRQADASASESSRAAEPIHVVYYGGVDGRVWKFGFRASVAKLAGLR